MKLTKEQHLIIQSEGHIKINGVARQNHNRYPISLTKALWNRRIHYFTFNKLVKQVAIKKFEACALQNVSVDIY